MADAHALLLLTLLAAAGDGAGSTGEGPGRAGDAAGSGDDGQADAGSRDHQGRLGRLAATVSNAVLEGLDPDAIVDRLDVDGIVSRIDVEALVARIDPDDIVARTDLDALLDEVDPDRLLDRVDVNRLLDRVDVDHLLDGVDVNRLLDRVDVDRLLDRADVDRLLERVDVEALVQRARVPELVAESTGQMAGSALDLVRQQVVALDVILMRVLVGGLLRRDLERLPAGPGALVGDETGEAPTPAGAAGAAGTFAVTGHYAGPLSRLAAYAGDLAAATASFTAVSAGLAYVLGVVFGLDIDPAQTGPVWLGLLVVWMFAYWWASTAVAGRTPAMLLLGLRIVARDGSALRQRAAVVRTLLLPVTTVPFGIGFLGLLLDRERRALHDLGAGSVVVYDWGGRTARLPSPLGRFLSEHGAAPDDRPPR
jgi:uncharacterized RDD family membrane protein YckC